LTAEQETEVEQWVRRGGTLVVTDPGSTFTPPVSFAPPPLAEGDDVEAVRPERCDVDALADVQEVNGGALVRYRTDGATGQCFSNRDGAFVVVTEEGDGEIVSIGGAAFVTNDLLGDVDNAVLAAALLAPEPGTAVRFVDAPLPAGGGDKTLADLVPG